MLARRARRLAASPAEHDCFIESERIQRMFCMRTCLAYIGKRVCPHATVVCKVGRQTTSFPPHNSNSNRSNFATVGQGGPQPNKPLGRLRRSTRAAAVCAMKVKITGTRLVQSQASDRETYCSILVGRGRRRRRNQEEEAKEERKKEEEAKEEEEGRRKRKRQR